jgi:hypothetical protein
MTEFTRPETLLKCDGCTLAIERLPEGKMRVRTGAWEDGKTILDGEVLEVRFKAGQVHVLRRGRVEDPDERIARAQMDKAFGPVL